jgi:putative DNA primase/helicase
MKKHFDKEQWLAEKRAEKQQQIHWYLQMGWAVFPVNQYKVPMIRNGCRGASNHPDVVRQWWEAYPDANVAIATGRRSGLVVIDVDIKNGKDGLASLHAAYGDCLDIHHDQQLTAKTPSGGFHLYYQWDESIPVTVAVDVLPGIDIRGEGGYVLAPPSGYRIKDAWKKYQWYDSQQPIPKVGGWVADLLQKYFDTTQFGSEPSSSPRNASLDVRQILIGVREGKRDDQIFRYACHLRQLGIDYYLAHGFICEAAARCIPPFSEQTALEKVERAYRMLELNLPDDTDEE